MIHYNHGGMWIIYNIFTLKGSVFPQALMVAIPCGLLSGAIKLFAMEVGWDDMQAVSLLNNNAAWSGFSFLVGFLIVFRTSQAYNRFWDGCIWTHQMRAEWFDACSSVVAFCKHSDADAELVQEFKELIVRLFSMLHAAALGEIEDSAKSELTDIAAFHMELIDPEGVDNASMTSLKLSDCKVELIFQWIQQLMIENMLTGVLSVPPPILSRTFQEIASGMIAFHQAIKISYIPFPFPYAQICDCLLIMHWMVAPLVCALWASNPGWAGLFCVIQVFILWALNFIAVEIENPFGMDENDLDGEHMQTEMNRHLSLLLQADSQRTPRMKTKAERTREAESLKTSRTLSNRSKSFIQCWTELDQEVDEGDGESFQLQAKSEIVRSSRNTIRRDSATRATRRSINESMVLSSLNASTSNTISSDRNPYESTTDSDELARDSERSLSKKDRQVSIDVPPSGNASENGFSREPSYLESEHFADAAGVTGDIPASQNNQVRLSEQEAVLRPERHVLEAPALMSQLSLPSNDESIKSLSSGLSHLIGVSEVRLNETGNLQDAGIPIESFTYQASNGGMPIDAEPQCFAAAPRSFSSLHLLNRLKPQSGVEQL